MANFNIKNVGTNHGDCFFVEIENDIWKNVIMVDGRKGDWESLELIEKAILEYGRIDYLVITHIDEDHLNGALLMLKDDSPVHDAFARTIIIYNYVTKPVISYKQAEQFENLILNNTVISTILRNYLPYSSPCLKIIDCEKRKALDPKEQKGDYAVMTLISPKKKGIDAVHKDYRRCYGNDKSANYSLVNRNSIVFLLEYEGKCVLFTGDSDIKNVEDEIVQLKNMRNEKGEYCKVDVIKIPHHGAFDDNKGLLQFAKCHQCTNFIVTGEKEWDEKHPSKELLSNISKEMGKKINVYTNVEITFENDEDVNIIHEDDINVIGEEQ